jgi:hypothetical protein
LTFFDRSALHSVLRRDSFLPYHMQVLPLALEHLLMLGDAPPGAHRIFGPCRQAFGAAFLSGFKGASTFRALPESSFNSEQGKHRLQLRRSTLQTSLGYECFGGSSKGEK